MAYETVRNELQSMADAYQTMDRLLAENEELKARVDVAERQAMVAESENQNLCHQIRRASAERDFNLRRYVSLSAKLQSLSAAMSDAIRYSDVEARGDRPAPEPQPEHRPEPSTMDDGAPPPKFIIQQSHGNGSDSVVDLAALAASIVPGEQR